MQQTYLTASQAQYQDIWIRTHMQKTGCRFEHAVDRYIERHYGALRTSPAVAQTDGASHGRSSSVFREAPAEPG